jgi:hypothetical protein
MSNLPFLLGDRVLVIGEKYPFGEGIIIGINKNHIAYFIMFDLEQIKPMGSSWAEEFMRNLCSNVLDNIEYIRQNVLQIDPRSYKVELVSSSYKSRYSILGESVS